MPRQPKYTREEIVESAFSLVRAEGEAALSARRLAGVLGCSTAPLFVAFSSIEELLDAVRERAWAHYQGYLRRGMQESALPFKGAGLAYVRFAREEPHLFRMFFMKGSFAVTHYMPATDPSEGAVRAALEGTHGVPTETARAIYNHMSVYVHGLASLCAAGNATFTEEDVDRLLTEAFVAVKAYCTDHK